MERTGTTFLSGDRFFAGLDVGGTKTTMMVQNSNKIVWESTFPSEPEIGRLHDLILGSLKKAGVPLGEVGAMAIGIPGRVNPNIGLVIDAPGLGWKNILLEQELFQKLPFPCVVENDITMALIGETSAGKAQHMDDVVFLALGTGLGSAILANGLIISGAGHSAGEIGYCVFDEKASLSFDNNDGCFGPLENRVSGRALEKAAEAFGITPQELLRQYHAAQPAQREPVDDFLLSLCVAIANLMNILNPEMVVLGGGVSESLEPFLAYIRRQVSRLTPLSARIEISSFYNRTGAIGACRRAEQLCRAMLPGTDIPDMEAV